MDKNIIEQIVVPYNPPSANVVQRNQYNLFAPMGGINRVGMVGYSADDFVVKNDILFISPNARPIVKNAEAIAKNTEAITKNTNAITNNTEAITKNTEAITKNTNAITDEATARENADNSIKDKLDREVSRLSSFIDSLAEDRTVTKVLTEDDSKLGMGTSVVQVGAALKYGLINYVSGDTKYIRTYVPYDLDNARAFGGANVERVGNTLIFPKGSKYGVYIPVDPSIIGSFTIRAYGRNDSGDYWMKVTPFDSKNAVTGSSETLGSEVYFGDYTSSIQIIKYNASVASIDDMPLYDIQIEATPGQGEAIYQYPLYNAKTYEILPEVRDLCVNGWKDTINLITRKIEHSDGTSTDISEYIQEDFCEIPLMSSSIIRFEDGDGKVNCRFKITYKERIHGNLNNKL